MEKVFNRVYDVMRPGNNGSRATTGSRPVHRGSRRVAKRGAAVTTRPDDVATRPDTIATVLRRGVTPG